MSDLHGGAIPRGSWWACAFPERPLSEESWIDTECRSCLIALGAHATQSPDAAGLLHGEALRIVTAAQLYEANRRNVGLPPLAQRPAESGVQRVAASSTESALSPGR